MRRPDERGRLTVYGGIEAGGSKWECAIGTGPDDLRATTTLPTTTPAETIDRTVAFFEREGPVDAIGIGSFGPLDGNLASPTWGYITTTPKPGWAQTDFGREIKRRLGVPVAFDTDVTQRRSGSTAGEPREDSTPPATSQSAPASAAAAWSAASSCTDCCTRSSDTCGSRTIATRTRSPGVCPYHGDCWEGLASGRAIEARWEKPAAELDDDRPGIWRPGTSRSGSSASISRPLARAGRDRRRRHAPPGATGAAVGDVTELPQRLPGRARCSASETRSTSWAAGSGRARGGAGRDRACTHPRSRVDTPRLTDSAARVPLAPIGRVCVADVAQEPPADRHEGRVSRCWRRSKDAPHPLHGRAARRSTRPAT